MGGAVLNFYSGLVDLLGKCAPDPVTIHQGKGESLRARAILRSLISLEDLQAILSLRLTIPCVQPGQESMVEGELPPGLQPVHKQSVLLFLERVYGIDSQQMLFNLLESSFLADLRCTTMMDAVGFLYFFANFEKKNNEYSFERPFQTLGKVCIGTKVLSKTTTFCQLKLKFTHLNTITLILSISRKRKLRSDRLNFVEITVLWFNESKNLFFLARRSWKRRRFGAESLPLQRRFAFANESCAVFRRFGASGNAGGCDPAYSIPNEQIALIDEQPTSCRFGFFDCFDQRNESKPNAEITAKSLRRYSRDDRICDCTTDCKFFVFNCLIFNWKFHVNALISFYFKIEIHGCPRKMFD